MSSISIPRTTSKPRGFCLDSVSVVFQGRQTAPHKKLSPETPSAGCVGINCCTLGQGCTDMQPIGRCVRWEQSVFSEVSKLQILISDYNIFFKIPVLTAVEASRLCCVHTASSGSFAALEFFVGKQFVSISPVPPPPPPNTILPPPFRAPYCISAKCIRQDSFSNLSGRSIFVCHFGNFSEIGIWKIELISRGNFIACA